MVKCSQRLSCGRRCSRNVDVGSCWQHGGAKKRKRSRRKGKNDGGRNGVKVSKPKKFGKPKRGEWTIYGHHQCPYTASAFEYLKLRLQGSQKLVFYDLGVIKSESLISLRNYLANYLGSHGSMPMIFDSKGIFIGGYSDLVG